MSSRVTVFTNDGNFIGDLRAATRRSYILPRTGVVGECEFSIAKLDRHAKRDYLKWGRYLLIRHESLPPWIGVIYTPRSWSYSALRVKAYQAEKILDWRVTPTSQKFSGTAGSIFRKILEYTNAAMNNDKPIKPNIIFQDANSREEAMGDSALPHVQSVAGRSAQDFEVTHNFDSNGRLSLLGNWYERKGRDTGRYFREGYNMEATDNALEESGDLWNDIYGISDASTAGTRLTSHISDLAAIAEYGLYQKTVVFSGVTQQATLDKNVMNYLKTAVEAERQYDVNVINVNNEFSDLDVGNLWYVDTNYEGFSGNGFGSQAQVEILGIEYDDTNPKRARVISEVMQ